MEHPRAGLRPDPVLADGLERLRRASVCFIEIKGDPNGTTLELGSAQTRSWRTASNGFAGLWIALRSSAKPLEAVRQDRVWAEPSSRDSPLFDRTRRCLVTQGSWPYPTSSRHAV